MERVAYNNRIVEEHSLFSDCNSTLNAVSNRDYPNTNYFDIEIACLDMDTYEKQVLRRSVADNTMDAVIGISHIERGRLYNSQLMLVELRMDYRNTNNLSPSIMADKLSHTRELLGGEKPISQDSLFIFGNSVAERAKSVFHRYRRGGGELKHSYAYSVSEFSSLVVAETEVEWIPIHSAENIINSIRQYVDGGEWILFFEQIVYWLDLANDYNNKYKKDEYEHILKVVKNVWISTKETHPLYGNEDSKEYAQFLEDLYPYLLQDYYIS